MDGKEMELKEFDQDIQKFYGIEGEIDSSFLLNQGNGAGSLGKAKLNALLRKHNIINVNTYQINTWGELSNLIFGDDKNNNLLMPVLTPEFDFIREKQNGVGIDIELISRFNEAKDYWTDTFYRENFSISEIAYCIKQPRPIEHFAGKWCVKEALLKCFPQLNGLLFSSIEISRNENNQVEACVNSKDQSIPLPINISISHSEEYAIAIVLIKHTNSLTSQPLSKNNEDKFESVPVYIYLSSIWKTLII